MKTFQTNPNQMQHMILSHRTGVVLCRDPTTDYTLRRLDSILILHARQCGSRE